MKDLTKREEEVLELARHGYSIKMTADRLGIAKNTVQCIRQKIYSKLQCSNITGALNADSARKKAAYVN